MNVESAAVEKPNTGLSTKIRKFHFINSTKIWGGEERFVLDLAAGLKASGHTAMVYGRPGTEFLPRMEAAGLETRPFYAKFDYDFFPLGRFPASFTDEVFVATTPRDFKLLRMLAFLRPKAKFFWHLGVAYPEPTWEYRRLLKGDKLKLITPSHYLKSRILNDFPALENRISVLPSGVDVPAADTAAARRKLAEAQKLSLRKLFLGIFSRLVPGKGHSLLFHTLQLVKKRGIGFHLWVVGGGERERLEKELWDLGLAGDVTFTGFQEDVVSWMAGVDAVLLPSEKESFPYVVLEAMALGKTVLASEVGGLPEMIEKGRDGVLLPSKDTEAWATAIIGLARNPEKRKELGEAARRSVKERFSLEQMISRFLEMVDAHSAVGRT